jgi:predicted lipoprotein with Yx(FWY)xxD motif
MRIKTYVMNEHSNTSLPHVNACTNQGFCNDQAKAANLAHADVCVQGWPEPFIFIVYDHISGDFTAKNIV